MPEISVRANFAPVTPFEKDTALIKALAEFTGLSPSRMAADNDIAATTLTRPANGKQETRIGVRTLEKLRAAYPTFPQWSLPGTEVEAEPTPPANATTFRMEGASEQRMRQDVPVYGTALGAEEIINGEAVEQTYLNTGETITYFKRPVLLDGRTDVYGLFIQGSSMSPRYKDGEKAFVDPKRPPRNGDDVVVYLRSPDEVEGERDGAVLIKELVRRTSTYIELLQHNPHTVFRLPIERYSKVHRVIPPSEWVD